MEHDDEVPGVTFRMVSAQKGPPSCEEHVFTAVVTLRAEVADQAVWDEVVSKLSPLRIYSVANLAEELVAVTQKRATEAQMLAIKRIGELEAQLARANQKISFYDQLHKEQGG